MESPKPHKPDPKNLEDHPYNREDDKPDRTDRWFRYAIRIILFLVLAFFAYRIIQGENFFDVVGGFFKDGMQSW